MDQIAERKMSLLQNIRKKFYLKFKARNVIKARKEFRDLPMFLKQDKDVIGVLINGDFSNNISDDLISIVKEVPYAITMLSIDQVKQMMIQKKVGQEYITFLPKEKQYEILINVSKDDLRYFPEKAILGFIIENLKRNLEVTTEIRLLSPELQLKLGAIGNKLIKHMSPEIQQQFVNDNYLLAKELRSEFSDYPIITGYDTSILYQTNITDINSLKSETNHNTFGNKVLNAEIIRYSGFDVSGIDNKGIQALIDVISSELGTIKNNEELKELLNEMTSDIEIDSRKVKDFLNRYIKVALNEDIARSIDGKEICELIKTNDRNKLLDMVGRVYGEDARKILEERPNISIDEISNFYIFNKSIMKEFSIGDIHNFLSYRNMGVNVITDLARYPEKMKQYKIFSKLTQNYFQFTPQDLDKKLIAFADFYELMDKINDDSEFSEAQIQNLQEMLTDYYHNTLPTRISTWQEVESYQEIKDRAYQEALEKITDKSKLKELIIGRFFWKEGVIGKAGLVADYDAVANNILTQNERDYIELIKIISSIDDEKVLMDLYKELLKDKTIVNPSQFDAINKKIEEHFNQTLTHSLLSPEDMIQKFEAGEKGVSVSEIDGIQIITLQGIDFFAYASVFESNMSGYEGMTTKENMYERWTTFEKGASTISGCLYGRKNILKMFTDQTVRFGFSDIAASQVVGMGYNDIDVTHDSRRLNPSIDDRHVLDYPDSITQHDRNSEDGFSSMAKNNPEIAIYRRERDSRKIKEDTFGGRIMPTYVFGKTKEEIGKMIKAAKKFNLKYIVLVDQEAYRDEVYDYQKNEAISVKPKKEDSAFIKKYKEVIEDGTR